MGGAIALSVAHARPRTVTRLVGIGTLGLDMPLPPGLNQLWAYRPGRAAARGLLELLHVDEAFRTDEDIMARRPPRHGYFIFRPGSVCCGKASFPNCLTPPDG